MHVPWSILRVKRRERVKCKERNNFESSIQYFVHTVDVVYFILNLYPLSLHLYFLVNWLIVTKYNFLFPKLRENSRQYFHFKIGCRCRTFVRSENSSLVSSYFAHENKILRNSSLLFTLYPCQQTFSYILHSR